MVTRWRRLLRRVIVSEDDEGQEEVRRRNEQLEEEQLEQDEDKAGGSLRACLERYSEALDGSRGEEAVVRGRERRACTVLLASATHFPPAPAAASQIALQAH